MTRITKMKKTYEPASGFNVKPLALPIKSNNPNSSSIPTKAEKEAKRRRERRLKLKEKSMICFSCRKYGHSVKQCPESVANICYRCGSTEHILSKCKKTPEDAETENLKFAKCFYCQKIGHLSKDCKDNEKGLYPNGGGCKFCGSIRHFAHECSRGKKQELGVTVLGTIDAEQGADDDDVFIEIREQGKKQDAVSHQSKKKKKVVKF